MKTKTKGRKLLSTFLSLCMAVGLCAGFETTAFAAGAVEALSGWLIFANGNAIIIDKAGDNGAANVYLDENRNGTIDTDESTPVVLTGFDVQDSGYDLSGAMVFGGSMSDTVAGDAKITMLGGTVDMLYGGGMNGVVNGDTYVTMTGGQCSYIYGGGSSAPVKNTNVFIGGSAKIIANSTTYSPGYVYGGGQQDNCTVTGNVSITVDGQAEINQLYGGSAGQMNGNQDIQGDVTIELKGGTVNDSVTPGAAVSAKVCGTGKVILNGGTVGTIYGTNSGDVKNVVIEMKGGSVGSVLPATHGNAETAVIDLSGGSIGGNIFSDANENGGTLGSMVLNLSGNPVFTDSKKGIVLREGQTATVTGELTGEIGSIYIYSLVTEDGTVLVRPQSAAQNDYLDHSKFKLVNVDSKAIVPGTGGKEHSLIIGALADIRNTTITATATIPSPTYTVTIPSTVDAGALTQKKSSDADKIKSTEFTVSASSVENLFGAKKIIVTLSTAGGSFELADGDSKLAYSVFNEQSGGSALQSGAAFTEFTAEGNQTGRIEIDQSAITRRGSYTGTMTFTISLADVAA